MPNEILSEVSETRFELPVLHEVMKPENVVNRSSTLLRAQESGALSWFRVGTMKGLALSSAQCHPVSRRVSDAELANDIALTSTELLITHRGAELEVIKNREREFGKVRVTGAAELCRIGSDTIQAIIALLMPSRYVLIGFITTLIADCGTDWAAWELEATRG